MFIDDEVRTWLMKNYHFRVYDDGKIYDPTEEVSGFICSNCGRILAPLGCQLRSKSWKAPKCDCLLTLRKETGNV